MTPTARPVQHDRLNAVLEVRPLGLDDFANVRHLHATSLCAQTADVLSDTEVAAFTSLVYSPAYSDMLMQEAVYGGWIEGDLVGTASWHASSDDGATARIASIYVRHPRLGIGRRLMAEVEAHAYRGGFHHFTASATANAVPFFQRLGYQVASRGVRTLAPACALPVTFLRKLLPPLPRSLAS